MNALRVGMVGSGFIARVHSLAYNSVSRYYWPALPDVLRVRIADVTADLARTGAARLGWEGATSDWREITRSPDVDLVDIVTPNDTHAEIAIDAARHGKDIFCEKPLAPDVASARKMYEAVSEAGIVHQVGFAYRRWPAVQLAKQVTVQGQLGRILHFHGLYFHDYGLDPYLPISWRFEARRAGAGSIGDLGSHVIDIARYLVGEIVRVLARSRTFITRRPLGTAESDSSFRRGAGGAMPEPSGLGLVDVDDATDMLVEFDNGATGVIQTSWMAGGHKNDLGFELFGDRGAVRFSWQHANELSFYSTEDPEEVAGCRNIVIGPIHPGAAPFWPVPGLGMGYSDVFLIAIRDLLEAVAQRRPASPDFLDGLRACEVVDAAVRSAASGGWVDVARSETATTGTKSRPLGFQGSST